MTKKPKHAQNCITTKYDWDLNTLIALPQKKPVFELHGTFNITINDLVQTLQVSREFVRLNIQPHCRYIYLTSHRSAYRSQSLYSAFQKIGINYYGLDRVYLNTADVFNWFNNYFDIFTYSAYTPYSKIFKNYQAYFTALTKITDNLIRYHQYFPAPSRFVNSHAEAANYKPYIKSKIDSKYQDTVLVQALNTYNKSSTIKAIFKNTKSFTDHKYQITNKKPIIDSLNQTLFKLNVPKDFTSYAKARFNAIFDNYLIFKAKSGNKVLYYPNTSILLKDKDFKKPVTDHTMKLITQTLRVNYTNHISNPDILNKYLDTLNRPTILRKKLNRLFVRPA